MIREKFGVRPPLIPDLLALVGDSAEGYPGIHGIGKIGADRGFPKEGSGKTTGNGIIIQTPRHFTNRCTAI
jgi:hypothetical protein